MIHFISQEYNFKGKQLIIAFGVAPTTAADYLIAANKFKRIAFYHSQHLQPSVGYLHKNIQNGALGLPAEIYLLDDVLIIQVRTGLRFGRKKDFAMELVESMQKYFFSENSVPIFLLSLPYSIRPDIEIQSKENNVYFYESSQTKFNKASLISARELLDNDEEEKQILSEAGILGKMKQANIFGLFVFAYPKSEKKAALALAKGVQRVLNRKQTSGNLSPELLQ